MYKRKKSNKSGSISVQIFTKVDGKYKLIKSIGSSKDNNEVENLLIQAHEEIRKMSSLQSMFVFEKDQFILDFLQNISNHQIKTVGPELIFGKIYNKIGYNAIDDRLFRHLVISRLSFPLRKLKTVDYLQRYLGIEVKVDKIYRFMDKLSDTYKFQVEQISFQRTKELLNGKLRSPKNSIEYIKANPVISNSAIRYIINESCEVSLDILDNNGTLVKNIVNSYHKPGTYDIKIDSKDFKSGTYFASLRACDQAMTLKFIVIR